jgi:hypothetical protein
MSSATSSFSPLPVLVPAVGRCVHQAYTASYLPSQVVIDGGGDQEEPSALPLYTRSWTSRTASPTLSAAPLAPSRTLQPPVDDATSRPPPLSGDVVTQRLTFKTNPSLLDEPPVKDRRLVSQSMHSMTCQVIKKSVLSRGF